MRGYRCQYPFDEGERERSILVALLILFFVCFCMFVPWFIVSPAKHGRHILIMTPSASSSAASSGCHTFGFQSITFEGYIKFIQSLQKGKTS